MQHLLNGAGLNTAKPGSELIKESDTARFAADVLDASRDVPVIVDFWAPWCGPCKQLGPALEKLVREAKGAVRMVKINVDQNQELAAQMRVQSIPAVYAFHEGRPVDGFVGAVPESELKAFVKRVVAAGAVDQGPSPLEEALEAAAMALDEGDVEAAAEIFVQVLQHQKENLVARAGLARCHVLLGDLDEAERLLDEVPVKDAGNAAIATARATLDLARTAAKAGPLRELQARLDANPADHQARLDFATALYANNRREEAVDALLELIRRDREWNEQAGRKQLVKLFEAFGPTDPLTLSARRRLSALLFS